MAGNPRRRMTGHDNRRSEARSRTLRIATVQIRRYEPRSLHGSLPHRRATTRAVLEEPDADEREPEEPGTRCRTGRGAVA
jgi:hypothetical protein